MENDETTKGWMPSWVAALIILGTIICGWFAGVAAYNLIH